MSKNDSVNLFKILAKLARMSFVYSILQYRLALFKSDFILDYTDHMIIVLKDIPGILILKLETTNDIITHYEAHLMADSEKTFLDCFYLDEKFPTGPPILTIVK